MLSATDHILSSRAERRIQVFSGQVSEHAVGIDRIGHHNNPVEKHASLVRQTRKRRKLHEPIRWVKPDANADPGQGGG